MANNSSDDVASDVKKQKIQQDQDIDDIIDEISKVDNHVFTQMCLKSTSLQHADTIPNPEKEQDECVVKFFMEGEYVRLPQYATDQSAGIDLFLREGHEPITILPQSPVMINTGIRCQLAKGTWGLLKERSSLAKNNIIVIGGVIDADYRGEIKVMLYNLNKDISVDISTKNAVVQMIVMSCCGGMNRTIALLNSIFELDSISTAEHVGFGSTDVYKQNNE